jgi:4-deoxy-L-threo-5-hexosulose-uronate ketol-isomerase
MNKNELIWNYINFDTTRLREEFLIETLFVPGELQLVYSHVDRFITGGVISLANAIKLEADPKESYC